MPCICCVVCACAVSVFRHICTPILDLSHDALSPRSPKKYPYIHVEHVPRRTLAPPPPAPAYYCLLQRARRPGRFYREVIRLQRRVGRVRRPLRGQHGGASAAQEASPAEADGESRVRGPARRHPGGQPRAKRLRAQPRPQAPRGLFFSFFVGPSCGAWRRRRRRGRARCGRA